MNEYYVKALKSNLESSLRELLIETLQNAQELPEMMHGTMVMSKNLIPNLKFLV